jgi:pSer/pThr/pTyr-binding forkhead associated (FHA) protein
MNVRLVLERKRKRVWITDLSGPETTLGRASSCNIRVPSAEVSRVHCRLRIENGLVTVEDLESVNGTFLNGERVHSSEIVRPGDRLSLGSITFVVEYELTADALRRLSGEVDFDILEPDEEEQVVADIPPPMELEPVEDTASQPTLDYLPLVEPVEETDEIEAEVSLLGEQEELHLPEGGELRDFLIELDDTDEQSRNPRR